ncbi:MAG: DUF2948 family protein [Henriciella sp.]|nr:DUF2948 family protein [Henriciella sp.]
MADPKPLRLIVQDGDDLEIVSAAVQDAVLKAGNLKLHRRERRFTIELNRYRWETPEDKSRVRAILGVDTVLGVRTRAVSKADPDMVMSLLSLEFTPDPEPPGGKLSILFSGDGELELQVEALDLTLLDSTYEWSTRAKPDHEKRRR